MIRRRERTEQELIDLTLADGRAPVFEDGGQCGRIVRARRLLTIAVRWAAKKARIIELCCGSADISGPFSEKHDVFGVDVTPMAEQTALSRFPRMRFRRERVERVEPLECDVLVLCETLEHLNDPVGLVGKWLPLAQVCIIGHPLCAPEKDPEEGHAWSYDEEDFKNWFAIGGHDLLHYDLFPMTCYATMVLGIGKRRRDGISTRGSAGPADD